MAACYDSGVASSHALSDIPIQAKQLCYAKEYLLQT